MEWVLTVQLTVCGWRSCVARRFTVGGTSALGAPSSTLRATRDGGRKKDREWPNSQYRDVPRSRPVRAGGSPVAYSSIELASTTIPARVIHY